MKGKPVRSAVEPGGQGKSGGFLVSSPPIPRLEEKSLVLAPSAAMAYRALSWQHNVALVRAFRTGVLAAAVHRGAKEVGPRVDARRVDVVVFGEVAHGVKVVGEESRRLLSSV